MRREKTLILRDNIKREERKLIKLKKNKNNWLLLEEFNSYINHQKCKNRVSGFRFNFYTFDYSPPRFCENSIK
uniref:Uncharacterized protein n=1 Tax=Glossina brevipalpis TaxID=37001 RepID=A0A1A9W533_9MUSC